MAMFRPLSALVSCALASLSSIALAAQGEITVAQTVENMRVFCEYRIAAIFPGEPKIEDIMYQNGGMTVPARVFYVEEGMHRYSVTVADFTKGGPAIDDTIVENAAEALRKTGQVRFQFPEDYTPGIPGRQLNIQAPDGRQHRASVYMVDHRLVITETLAEPSDFAAIQFEQSVLMLDGTGRDLNNVANRTRYRCTR